MKHKEEYFVDNSQLHVLLSNIAQMIERGGLTVDGETVVLPSDKMLEFKTKYEHDEVGGELGFKLSWAYQEEIEDEEEPE